MRATLHIYYKNRAGFGAARILYIIQLVRQNHPLFGEADIIDNCLFNEQKNGIAYFNGKMDRLAAWRSRGGPGRRRNLRGHACSTAE